MRSWVISILWLFLHQNVVGQTISGKIISSNGDKILLANILIKDSINAEAIKEFVIGRNGIYTINIAKEYKQLAIEVSANKYQKQTYVIDSFNSKKKYTHDFFLVKDSIVQLKEIVVTSKVRPFQIKGDTVSYNVASYSDGTERKIQDVLKKLPGIEVNEKTGEIKYKGKPVETVKLDGEDLFSSNYAIGTKNINLDMVEQVQAIENYSDNPTLKGLENGDKVALNLALKKKKADYSGNLEAGLGMLGTNTAIDASTNILGISKKYKSFATLSYNNIGINSTPFDYFSYNPNLEQQREIDLLAKKYIPDTYFDTDIDPKRSNINNSFFGSYNNVFKVGKKFSLRANLYYLNDKLTARQKNITSNIIGGQQFTTSDDYSIVKKPGQIRGDFDAKYNISKKSLLEYAVQNKREKIDNKDDVLQNNNASFNTVLVTKDNYFKQALTYTTRISQNKALQFIASHSFNDLPQKYNFSPAVFDSSIYNSNMQTSWFKKNNLNLEANLLGTRSNEKYALSAGVSYKNMNYNSDLKGETRTVNLSINGFQNNFDYTQKNYYLSSKHSFQFKQFGFTPAIKVSFLQQSLSDHLSYQTKDKEDFLIEPRLLVVYKVNNQSAFMGSTAFNQNLFTEEYLVSNPVYISNRVVKTNEAELQVQKNKVMGFFYLMNNLYKQFQINLGANYVRSSGNYFSNLFIQQNNTRISYFFLPEKNKFWIFSFMVEKYVPLLQSTVRFKNDYTKQFYKNIVNNSSLRSNITDALTNELFFKTAFDGEINFENTFRHKLVKSETEGRAIFDNQTLSDNFQLIVKPSKRLVILFSTDYFLPKLTQRTKEYLFFDANISYQTKNKVYDFRFKARNITNYKYFNQFYSNDYSTSHFQTSLLQRHFLISLSRNF
jgi:hypothetical protein